MFQPGAALYTAGFGVRPENIEVPHVDVRSPNSTDTLYPVGKWWLNVGNSLWYLLSQSSSGGTLVSNWIQVGGSGGPVVSVNGTNGVTTSPSTGSVVVQGINATTSTVGVASFNPEDFTVNGSGQVSTIGTSGVYTPVDFSMSPYDAKIDDYFISVDATDGPVIINLLQNPVNSKQYIVMDRLGVANMNNITVTALGGSTINNPPSGPPVISYTLTDNFDAIELFFHGTNYEVF